MKSGLMKVIGNKLAAFLAMVMLVSTAVPAGAAAADAAGTDVSPTITQSVYDNPVPGGGIPPKAVPTAAALSWNLLSKLNHSAFSMMYAAIDTPFSKLSSDEKYLAFMSYLTDNPAALGRKAVVIQDRSTGLYHRVLLPDTTGSVLHFDMTPDARYIAYTYAESVISGKSKVYVYDRITETLETVTGVTGTNELRGGDYDYVSVSADGRYVAFDTEADGLVSGDNNGKRDVYLYDRQASGSKLERISIPKEENSFDVSGAPSISADGSSIAFVSTAKLTDSTEYYGSKSIYLYERHAGTAPTVSVISEGESPSISADGARIAFATNRDDLGAADTNFLKDIYVYDKTTTIYSRVSRQADGSDHLGESRYPSISRNGAYVAYETVIDDNNRDTDIYVADSLGLGSAKVDVPGAPFQLSSNASRPTVNDTGTTVTFFSLYWERIGDTPFETFDYFLASNGSAPVWPAGAALQASNVGADHLTLSWPEASDPDGIAGYTLYKNGTPVAYIPAAAGRTYTLTGQVREPDMSYIFQVDAIDNRYHTSLNGPAYTWDPQGGGTPPPTEYPTMVSWFGERSDSGGPLIQGGKITVLAQGKAGRTATVEWTYKEYGGAGDATVTNTASLVLQESAGAPGLYTGSFHLSSGTTELSSLKLTVSGNGTVEEDTADELPLAVGGALQVQFTGATPSELQGAVLRLMGSSSDEYITLGPSGVGNLNGLWPGEYTLSVYTPNEGRQLGSLEGVLIKSGRTTNVIVPVQIPAKFRVQVLNPEGKPVPDVPVTLRDESGQPLEKISTGYDGMTSWREGFVRDQIVTAELDLQDYYYELAPGTNLSTKLAAGDNVLTVQLIAPDRGRLEVTVRDPENKPLYNAYVSATQTYKGKPVVTQGRTSLDGKVRFELFAGEVVLEAQEPSYLYSSSPVKTQVIAQTITPFDLPVKQQEKGVVNLRVFKKALDTEWQGPLNMENESFLSMIESNYGWVKTYYSNAVQLGGSPGTPVEVCVSGVIYALVSQCKNVIMDENSKATAEIRLEETGARVQGNVEVSRDIFYNAAIYELKGGGSREYIKTSWDNDFQSTPFNINVPKGGSYRMVITKGIRENYKYRYEYANVEFTVDQNQIKNIGTIAFNASNTFTNQSGNYFTALPSQAVPGGSITLRAGYSNIAEETAANAVLLLDIPEGMMLVSDANGNKAVTGAKGPVTVDGKLLTVPLGDIAKGEKGTVTYKLAVDPSFNKSSLSASARIKTTLGAKAVEETIGTVHLDTAKVTLDAPDRMSAASRQTVVSGYAPAGSTVEIYDTKVRIGGAVANASGIWKTTITLIDLGSPSMHALWAVTSQNNVTLQSDKAFVSYDTNGTQLVRMAFAQAPANKWVTLETDKEPPSLVYTVVPGNPFQFDFEFTNPDKVENVRVYMEGQEGDPIPAFREGTLFRAVVPTTHDALGGIYVDYDVVKEPVSLEGSLPDLEQVRASLPPKLKDFEVVSMEPFALSGSTYQGSAVLKFPQLQNMKMSLNLSVDLESAYQPTEEEMALANGSDLPAIGKTYDFVKTDKELTVKIDSYVPRDVFTGQQPVAKESKDRVKTLAFPRLPKINWEKVTKAAKVTMEVKATAEDAFGDIKEPYDVFSEQKENMMEYAEKINKIMYRVESSGMDCLDEMPTTAKDAGKALAAVVLGEVAKTALDAGTAAMSLSGPGAIAAGLVTKVVSHQIDNYVDASIEKIGTGYNQCNDKDKKKKKGRKVANPKWIYDPSGFVYEAVKRNPIEGVTATVQYLNTNTGTWEPWDAKEYDQINPQLTDTAGKYGWDVPPGKWRVKWTKDGYEPLLSRELDVPPPHTEVNAGLISRAAPVVSTVTGVTYQGGSYVDMTFSKYLKVTKLNEAAVTVTRMDNTALQGTAEFIKAEESAEQAGVMLSRTIRFTTKEALTAGTAYQVKLDRSFITSYANVKMEAANVGPHPFTVSELDTAGPVVQSVKVESGGRIVRLTFNEPIQTSGDASKFQLSPAAITVNSAVAMMPKDAAVTKELVLTLSVPVTGTENLTLMAGAVNDIEGNASAAGTVSLSPDLNPNLKALTVGTGSLSPAFSAAVTEYVLSVPTGTKELAVTAAAADEHAKLTIGGELAVSGLAKTVIIPENGVIPVKVVIGGGAAEKVYTIRIIYSQNGGGSGSGGGGGGAPSTKDPLNLGETAVIESKPASNGGNALIISIRKEAVTEALKDGGKSKKLYVEVKDLAAEYVLQFPLEALKQLEKAKASVAVKTHLTNVKLDAQLLESGGLAEGSTIRLVIAKAAEALNQDAAEAARRQSDALQLMSGVVIVRAEALSGNQVTPLSLAGKGTLQGEIAVPQAENAEVYRFDEASASWIYVRSKKSEGGKGLLFHISVPGPYAVMSYTNRFKDTAGHWAQQDIDWIARRLVVNGVSQTDFRPEAAVTRAEFAAMLVRALGLSGAGNTQAGTFADVSQDAWYYEAVAAAVSKGLVNGLESGRFAPNEQITREQMAVMISRAYQALGLASTGTANASDLEQFSDNQLIQDWAKEGAALALKEGLMQGMTNDSFQPGGITTRAQAAVVLVRLLKKQE